MTLFRLRAMLLSLTVGAMALALPVAVAMAQTKITVGNIPGSTGFFISSYMTMYKGFFKREGLNAKYVKMGGNALVTPGMGGTFDFLPIPGGCSVALLKGHQAEFRHRPRAHLPVRIVVNPKKSRQSRTSRVRRWAMAAPAPPPMTRAS